MSTNFTFGAFDCTVKWCKWLQTNNENQRTKEGRCEDLVIKMFFWKRMQQKMMPYKIGWGQCTLWKIVTFP